MQAEGGFVTFSSGKTLSPDKPLTRDAIQQPIFTEISVSVSLIVPKGNTLILGPFPVNRSFPSNSKAILKSPKQEHVKNRQPMVLFITLQPKCVEKQEAAINAKPLVPDSPVEISSHAVTLPRSTLATSAFAKHLPSVAQEGPNSTGDLPSHGWLAGVLSSEEAASVLQLPDIKVIAGPEWH